MRKEGWRVSGKVEILKFIFEWKFEYEVCTRFEASEYGLCCGGRIEN